MKRYARIFKEEWPPSPEEQEELNKIFQDEDNEEGNYYARHLPDDVILPGKYHTRYNPREDYPGEFEEAVQHEYKTIPGGKEVMLHYNDDKTNSHKYYRMQQIGPDEFVVTYGRIGKSGQVMNYPMTQWSHLLGSKLKKGYKKI